MVAGLIVVAVTLFAIKFDFLPKKTCKAEGKVVISARTPSAGNAKSGVAQRKSG